MHAYNHGQLPHTVSSRSDVYPPRTPLCVSVHTRVPVGCPGLCGGCGAAPGWGSRGSAFKSGWEPGAREAAPAEPRSQQVSAGGRGDRPQGTWGPAGRGGWRALGTRLEGCRGCGDPLGGTEGTWGPAIPWGHAPCLSEFKEHPDDAQGWFRAVPLGAGS